MQNLPKAVKRHLRELSNRAYEAELRRELNALSEKFDVWKEGKQAKRTVTKSPVNPVNPENPV